jgi:hypothetical protein
MRIWIDESGPFSGIGQMPSPSCVGALIVPDAKVTDLERLYGRLRLQLPKDKGEVKGRLLTGRQVAEVVSILKRCEALFEISVIELGMHTTGEITNHQAELATRIGANITDEHPDFLRAMVADTKAQLLAFKLPLFIQSILTMELLRVALEHATGYFSQRRPAELAAFHWVVDGKEPLHEKTPWEKWWSGFLAAYLQAQTLARPSMRIPTGDYSHLDRNHATPWPEYLEQLRRPRDRESMVNLGAIFGDHVRFSTDAEPGLELVDILTNGVRRALLNHLEPEGWQAIRSLMIHREDQYVQVLAFNEAKPRLPYRDVLLQFKTGGKVMAVPSFWRDR